MKKKERGLIISLPTFSLLYIAIFQSFWLTFIRWWLCVVVNLFGGLEQNRIDIDREYFFRLPKIDNEIASVWTASRWSRYLVDLYCSSVEGIYFYFIFRKGCQAECHSMDNRTQIQFMQSVGILSKGFYVFFLNYFEKK